MKYLIWHRYSNQVAVNLGGQKLENMTRAEADQIMSMIHADVRPLVEVRPMAFDKSSAN